MDAKLLLRFFVMLYAKTALIQCAKILAVFPFPGPSQLIAVLPYLKALADRGHEMTVINPHPQKFNGNFTVIPLVFDKAEYDDLIQQTANASQQTDQYESYLEYSRSSTLRVLENEGVKGLLQDKSKHFDLIIIETLWIDALYGLGPHFDAPLVGFTCAGTDKYIDELVGNDSPLSYIPLITSPLTDRMDFWQRLQNLYLAIQEHFLVNRPILAEQTRIYDKYFAHLNVPLREVRRNFSLLLVNQHFSLSFPRPLVPNMIEVGGFSLNHKPKALPKHIAEFVAGADHGVVYFSMGSNFKSKFFSHEKRNILLNVFAKLKQRVLWKFEDSHIPDKPHNVLISQWFPQPDLLAHPNVKLFITHGGISSTIETIYHAKPVVGIPIFFDQFLNIERARAAGFGVTLSFKNLNEDDMYAAIMEILSNPKYTKAVRTLSKRYHDQPIQPLDKAIFWTEYVLRHNGAEHMRVAARNLNFFQFYNLDIFAFLFCIFMIISGILVYFVKQMIFMYFVMGQCEKYKSD